MRYIILYPNEQKDALLKVLENEGFSCKEEKSEIVLYCNECNLLKAQTIAMKHRMVFEEIKDFSNTNFY